MSEPNLSDRERELISAILDQLIPASADGRLAGAGQVGLVPAIERALAQTPAVRPVIEQGLATFAELVGGSDVGRFVTMSPTERLRTMKELESKDAGFLITLIFLAYPAYYQHPKVLAALGLEARPPHPGGYEMKPHDLTLLDPVRRRPKLFRQS